MFTKPKLVNNNKKKSQNEPTFYITVCYTCEADGATVPQQTGNDWMGDTEPRICLSSSVLKTSVKFNAVGKMAEPNLQLHEVHGRVRARHRNDILHSYEPGCRIVSVNVHEQVDSTAEECAHLETGFF